MIEFLYFAWVRERIGVGSERLELPAEVTSVAELLDWLAERSAGHAAALVDRSTIRVAIDEEFVGMNAPVASAREIAIFPPVTGG